MTGCQLCYPGECTRGSHEAAEALEEALNTCRICGATPGNACDFEQHRYEREKRRNEGASSQFMTCEDELRRADELLAEMHKSDTAARDPVAFGVACGVRWALMWVSRGGERPSDQVRALIARMPKARTEDRP